MVELVERLDALHVWPQSIADTYADILTPRQIEKLYEVGAVATEAAARIASLEAEVARLEDVIDVDRYKVAIGVENITKAINGRRWLSEGGRGPYAWDDERYQQEFGGALNEIDTALDTLRTVSRDWSDSPRDPLRVAKNRATARALLERPTHEN